MRLNLNDCSPALKKRIQDAIRKQDAGDRVAVPDANLEQGVSHATLPTGKNAYFTSPVSIHLHSVRTRLADSDGICYKYAIDQLVNSRVIEDDSPKYVKQVTFSQEQGLPERTIITIKETP